MIAQYPTYADVQNASSCIRKHVHRTPVMTSAYLNERVGADLHFKCECFQKAGSFKVRGASNAVFSLANSQAEEGVATHSSGNHGAALCYAAVRRGIPATVVMPTTASKTKRDAVIGYGGTVIECEPTQTARESTLADFVANKGGTVVHPYNDFHVIAGQATCAQELIEDVDGLDALVAPIGGGGLISGTCLTVSAKLPGTKVFAAEPQNADDAHRSLKAGHIIAQDAADTVADGLKTSMGDLTWHFVSSHVEGILLADEREIIEAMRLIWQRMKIVVEPSSAVALAAILKNSVLFAGKRVGVILTGGNVDLDLLPWQSP